MERGKCQVMPKRLDNAIALAWRFAYVPGLPRGVRISVRDTLNKSVE